MLIANRVGVYTSSAASFSAADHQQFTKQPCKGNHSIHTLCHLFTSLICRFMMHSLGTEDTELEFAPRDVFLAPSINAEEIRLGNSYTYHSQLPATIRDAMTTECVLGVDEAGRGPVLGEPIISLLSCIKLIHIHRADGLWAPVLTIKISSFLASRKASL